MYIGPWQELELARLLAQHRSFASSQRRQQEDSAATRMNDGNTIVPSETDYRMLDNCSNESEGMVLPRLPPLRTLRREMTGRRDGQQRSTMDFADAPTSSRSGRAANISIRYDRLLGCPPQELPPAFIREPSAPPPLPSDCILPQLVPRTRRCRVGIKSRPLPHLPTIEKRRLHLERVRRVYLRKPTQHVTADNASDDRPSPRPSSSRPSSTPREDDADLDDPLIAWSNNLDVDKLLESPQLAVAPIG
ncbi:hypothetical protein FOZ63_002945 [Perkinsus olseni]|uniref:Uncharacterized protein n=1 Tax=Perkinsus olseni TaxID=32597 RepID=A0A7J6QN08_PEROL|nr:hypothetical protein FOZ63_002945 [Perkinsus olseni]KAF4742070.1 hypothetical protein FOZ62_002631 [Perkinsus olseni]